MKVMEKLAHLHFVTDLQLAHFVEQNTAEVVDRQHQLFTNSSWAWIVQTALFLKDAGFSVSLSNEYDPDSINLGLANKVRQLPFRPDIYVVSIDADQLRTRWANLSIVQNQHQTGRSAYWIPHWPQPGLVPRSAGRKSFTHAGFFGITRHLYKNENWWKETCQKHGIKFTVHPPNQWHDYSDIDIAIGVRGLNRKRFNEKPPTKLFNAWLAGVVFIGGKDSAYAQVGSAERDYLLVENEYTLNHQLSRLQKETTLGSLLIMNGKNRSMVIGSQKSTLKAWIDLIEHHINPSYQRWRRHNAITKKIAFSAGIFSDLTIRGRNEIWREFKKHAKISKSN